MFDKLFDEARAALASAEFSRAADLFGQCVQAQPDHVDAWFMLGVCLDRCGRHAAALQAFGQVEILDASHPQAANAQAAMLSLLERPHEALAAFRRALQSNPGSAQILANIGIMLEQLDNDNEALAAYDAALACDPDHLGALSNRGSLLLKRGRAEEALADHRRFVACAPSNPIGHCNCAEALAALFRDIESLAACDAALRIDRHHVKAHIIRALMLAGLGRFEEAGAVFKTARHMNPATFLAAFRSAGFDADDQSATDPIHIYCLRSQERLQRCDWSGYDQFVATLAQLLTAKEGDPQPRFDYAKAAHLSLALPLSPAMQLALASNIAEKIAKDSEIVDRPARPAHTKIRVGYVSPDFRSHATAHLSRRIYGLHDRAAFEIYAYALQPDDRSPLRQEIVEGCDVFRECSDWSTRQIIACIRDDRIDILVDLAGYTDHARPAVFAAQAAPVTVAYMGYPGTSGASYIDYRLVDRIACPSGHEKYYTENLVYLPGSCCAYNDRQPVISPGSRREHGLPEDAFVFCCFNNSYKVEPKVFGAWMRLLQKVPHSVLWLYAPTVSVEKNLAHAAQACGVDAGRLVFARPQSLTAHISRYRLADLSLDTLYCNGHTTTLDALWAGLPVLTCAGLTLAGRLAASFLTTLGLEEMIADDMEAYEAKACRFALHPEALHAVRERLVDHEVRSRLFETDRHVRALERAFTAMHERHIAGLPPASMHID